MTTQTTTATTPHLFRCHTCLETYATEQRNLPAARCICGGNFHYLGQVNGGRLIYSIEAPACNYLCTDAVGKACSCQCGGANHGSHRTYTLVRTGDAPAIAPNDPDACIARAAELKAARAALWAAVDAAFPGAQDDYRANRWMDSRAAWDACRRATQITDAAMRLTSHAGRLKRLRAA